MILPTATFLALLAAPVGATGPIQVAAVQPAERDDWARRVEAMVAAGRLRVESRDDSP